MSQRKPKLFAATADILCEDLPSYAGGVLPSIQDLAKHYGVSTLTMWKAVHVLVDRGLLRCSHGRKIRIAAAEGSESSLALCAADRLCEAIRGRIVEGYYRAGRPLPKFDYFVEHDRVSRDTVARAYRMLRSEGLAHKRGRAWIVGQQSGGDSGVGPDVAFRASREAPIVLVLARDFLNWSAMCIAERTRAFSDNFYPEIEKFGVQTRIVLTREEGSGKIFPHGQARIGDLIRSLGRRYAGTLIADKGHTLEDIRTWVAFLTRFDRPVVWLDHNDIGGALNRSAFQGSGQYYRCRFDEAAAVGLARDALAALGHSEIGVANFRAEYRSWVDHRVELFRKADSGGMRVHTVNEAIADDRDTSDIRVSLAARGDRAAHEENSRVMNLRGSYLLFVRFPLESSGRVLLPLLQNRELTAILAPNDFLAIEYYFWFNEMGIRVPQDLSILSFDNYEEVRSFPLSTIDFGFSYLGYGAAHIFLGDVPVQSDRQGVIAGRCALLDRGSLGPPRSSHAALSARVRDLSAQARKS